MKAKKKKSKEKKLIKIIALALTLLTATAGIAFMSDIKGVIYNKLNLDEKVQSYGNYDEKSVSTNELILVNCEHPFSGKPKELVSVYNNKTRSYFVKDMDVYIHKSAMKPLNDMMDAFYKETSLKTVNVISAYRSIESQASIYNKMEFTHGKSYAEKYAQKPQYSEHHTGLAIDLALFNSEDGSSKDFDGKGEYKWFLENCHKYGFILRYTKEKEAVTKISYEPWHFRYVGKKAATYMKNHNLCLEEYLNKA